MFCVPGVRRRRLSGGVGVLPVDEFVDEGAAFLTVDELSVDEDGSGGFIVEAWHACGRSALLMVTLRVSA